MLRRSSLYVFVILYFILEIICIYRQLLPENTSAFSGGLHIDVAKALERRRKCSGVMNCLTILILRLIIHFTLLLIVENKSLLVYGGVRWMSSSIVQFFMFFLVFNCLVQSCYYSFLNFVIYKIKCFFYLLPYYFAHNFYFISLDFFYFYLPVFVWLSVLFFLWSH